MRWIWRLARLVMTILVVGILSSLLTVGTTAIVVDRYIQTALDKFHIPLGRNPLTLTSMWGVLLGSDHQTASSKNNASVDTNRIETAINSGAGSTMEHTGAREKQDVTKQERSTAGSDSGVGPATGTGTSGGKHKSPTPPDGSLPVMGGISSSQGMKGREAIVVSPDAISKSKERLSREKKDKIFATLMKKLPQEDWQHLSMLMEGGLTSSEILEVEQILAKHLNDEEYKEMREWMVGESKAGAN